MKCGGALESYRGIEGGHIFILGTHYSSKMNATYLDEKGESVPIVMGCYGIGVSRLMAAAIEQHHDDDGIRWPMPIAPFQAVVLALGNDDEVQKEAEQIYERLRAAGVEVLFDDREERPGVKFKDADLIGIPIRVTLGKRSLDQGRAEVKLRDQKEPELFPIGDIVAQVTRVITEAGS